MSNNNKTNGILNEHVNNEDLPAPVPKSIIDLLLAHQALIAANELKQEKSHDELWAAIHVEFPSLEVDNNYSIDAKYAKSGVAMLKNRKPCKHDSGIPDALAELLMSEIGDRARRDKEKQVDTTEH